MPSQLDLLLRECSRDPFKLGKLLWPDVTFYDKQKLIVRSVWDNDKTVVPAGHMLGKDFIGGFINLAFFLTRHPCRVVNTSVDGKQLEGVLWGEIRRFIQTSRFPLDSERGGPLLINHLHIRKVYRGETDGLSYLIGRVAAMGEGLSGHHIAKTGDGIPRTLGMADEASGVDQTSLEKMSEWANRLFWIGNPYECANDFKWSVEGRPGTADKGGDILRKYGGGYHRKVYRITAEDSPNVQLAKIQEARGEKPTGELLIPGVLPWEDYQRRLIEWDPIKQTVGLGGRFYKGAEVMMFPEDWLRKCAELADKLRGKRREAKAIGIDPAEGGDKTSMCAVDEFGVIELVAKKTPDTSVIVDEAIAFMHKHNVSEEYVCIDRGGGGKQHADNMRRQGYDIRTVSFGGSIAKEPKLGMTLLPEKVEQVESRGTFKDKRAQLYGELRYLMDPASGSGFAIPYEYRVLHEQLAPIPLVYEREKIALLPKHSDPRRPEQKSLVDLIGHSPDEADSLVLAVHGMLHESGIATAGTF